MSTVEKKVNPNEQKVIEALGAAQEATVDEVAQVACIGRTSARKYLVALEQAGKAKRTAGGREGKRRLPDRYSSVADEEPRWGAAEEVPAGADAEEARSDGPAERLRPGGLDRLVLTYMREHEREGPFGPSAVAKGLGRSSGAVGNCLERLASEGQEVLQVGERPRRYTLKG